MSSKQVRIPLTIEEADFIEELAEAEGVTFSAEVRNLMKLGLGIKKSEALDQLAELGRDAGIFEPPEFWTPETRALAVRYAPQAYRLVILHQLAEQSENSVLKS